MSYSATHRAGAVVQCAEIGWRLFLKYIVYVFFPYVFQKIHFESGTVLRKCKLIEDTPYLLPGYYVEVEVCRHRDFQCVYGPDYTPRRGLVRVSRRLYHQLYRRASINVFCQFNRGNTYMAKIWIAR